MEIEKICQTCGKPFKVPHWRSEAKYCCTDCRDKAAHAKPNVTCPNCGKQFHLKPSAISRCIGAQGFFCSKECSKMGARIRMSGASNHQYGLRGDKNASFKGSELRRKNNNLTETLVYAPWHPYRDKNGRVAKHRLIVEENYRLFPSEWFTEIDGVVCLRKDAIVHHIDGNHENNAVENLSIMTRGNHTSIHNKEYYSLRSKKTGRIVARVPLPVSDIEWIETDVLSEPYGVACM